MSEQSDKAREISDHVKPEVASLIVQWGQERLKAQQIAGSALDQRSAQAAAFQLVAVGLSVTLFRSEGLPGLFAVAAAGSFLVGTLLAVLGGVRPDYQHLPGQVPSWWSGTLDTEDFTVQNAHSWLAACTEDMIAFNEERQRKRARMLGRSVWLAMFGGLLLVLTAVAGAAA